MKEGKDLTLLGSKETEYNLDEPSNKILETFENRYPDEEYEIVLKTKEFTSLCPKTGQPDFGEIEIIYCPKYKCIESKSLKLYLVSFRGYGSFMESIVNKILNDLILICEPKYMNVTGKFNPRGGTYITVSAQYNEKDYE